MGLFDRFRRRSEADPRALVVTAIAAAVAERQRLSRRHADAVLGRVQLEHALADQRELLAETSEQITGAAAAADAAAARVRTDGDDPGPYLQTAADLRTQLEVVRTTLEQLDALAEAAEADAERAQGLLRDSTTRLDEVLRSELVLLRRVEQLERDRVIAAIRSGRPEPDDPRPS